MKGNAELVRNEETSMERGSGHVCILSRREPLALHQLGQMRVRGTQAASPNSEGSESEPCWKGEKPPAHTGELVCGQGLGRAAGDIE